MHSSALKASMHGLAATHFPKQQSECCSSMQVAIFIKVYLEEDAKGYLQPHMVAGAVSVEATGRMLHGPVAFGTHASCFQEGRPHHPNPPL